MREQKKLVWTKKNKITIKLKKNHFFFFSDKLSLVNNISLGREKKQKKRKAKKRKKRKEQKK